MPVLSLGTRLALITIVGSFLTVTAIMIVAYGALVDDFQNLLIRQQLTETRRIALAVEERLELKLDLLAESADMMSDGDSLHSLAEIQHQLNRQKLLNSLFPDGVVVLDEHATAIAENLYVPGRIGTNYSDRRHFRRAIKERLPVISRPLVGRATGVPLLSFVAPIESDEGDLLGLLSGTIKIGRTSLLDGSMLKRLKEERDTFKVIDIENFLYVEGISSLGEDVESLPPPGSDPLVDAAMSGISFGTVTDNSGNKLIYAASHLEKLNWLIIRAVPYELATAPAQKSFSSFLGISLAIAMLIASIGLIACRSATRHLDTMTQAIGDMAQNPSEGRELEVKGTLETRKLASAFNQLMRERDAIAILKEDFVSKVSHELRTPLTSINGALRLLSAGAVGRLPDKAGEMVDLALRNGNRLELLISDLLDFSKLSAGKVSIRLSSQLLKPTIESTVDGNIGMAREHGVSLHIDAPLDQSVRVDAHRLRQVLDNFISNAIKFSPSGGTVTIRPEQVRSGYTRIIVSDQGEGVPAAFENRLFERFAQADSGSSRSVKGTGLGLAICRELAILMHGQVGYFFDHGANFWIEVPNSYSVDRGCDESA